MADQYALRVSDSVVVPLRGQLLRLRVDHGMPKAADLAVGKRLRLQAPDGRSRIVQIRDHSITGGKLTQKRLEKTGEADVIIAGDEASIDGTTVDIGWTAVPAE